MHKKVEFPNKLRLIEVPTKGTDAVTVLFLFGVGSRYETKEINGVSHFIEHLMFKGTKKRATTLDISKELDGVGAEFNAFTGKDYTGYYIKINHKQVELAVDVLSDMLLNSKFDIKEINRERGVIIEEINMYQDNPMMFIESLCEESIYKGNTLGWDIAGPISVIKKVSRQQLIDFRDSYYQPGNCVVAIAGKVSEKSRKLIEQKFATKMKKNVEVAPFKEFKSTQKEFRIKIQHRDTKQVQLGLGFPAYGYNSDQTHAMHLLTIILGGNMSSRLFISVRERRGLAYFVRCFPSFYQDVGNIFIQSGLDVSRLEEAIKIIFAELKKIKKGVTAKELQSAKEFIRGKMVLNLEDSSHLAEYYAKQALLLGKTLTPSQKMAKYDSVTLEDVQKAAKDIFRQDKLNLSLVGPFKDKKRFEKLVNL
jgi:predicted Zn-dependent peptidase